MRYTIEGKTKKQEGIIEDFLKKEKFLKLVDKYDPFEKLGGEVKAMGDAIREKLISGWLKRITFHKKQLAGTKKFNREVEAGISKKIRLEEMQLTTLRRK